MKIRYFLGVLVMMIASAGWAGDDTAVNGAIEDLAGRLKVPAEMVSVVSQSQMTWPDSSMGCVRVGVKYEDILTSGSQLVLDVDGKQHFYQARPGKSYHYCVTPATKKRGPIGPPVK